MGNVGKVAIDLSKDPNTEQKFLDDINAILEIIEARNRMGRKAYIAEMDQRFRSVQSMIDAHAKSKVNQQAGILNLMNLRLTEEGASKLGQVAFEEVNRAYASKPISAENAKALALFVLSNPIISELLQKQNGEDLQDSLDEIIEAYNLIFNKYVEQGASSKASVRMSEKMKVATKTLGAYYLNDMHGFSKQEVEADPLKNAFKIGRILGKNARTAEYDTEERSAARLTEQGNRINEYQKLSEQQQRLSLGDGATLAPKLNESKNTIKDEL